MEKTGPADHLEPSVSHVHDPKGAAAATTNQQEHDLTVRDVFKNHKIIVWWCFYWAMAAIGWGFDAQINGAMISVESFRRDFGYVENGEAILPADWQSAFNVISTVGQFFGGFLCSYMADKIGRKNSLLVGIVVCSGGCVGEILSDTRGAFLASKLIFGAGLGFYLTLAPLACSELAPVALRGFATAGVNLGIALGQLLSNAVVKAFGERSDRWAYRGPFATQLFFALFLIVFLPFAPETPWYLARKNKLEQAKKSLKKLYGAGYDVDSKLAGIMATIEEEALNKSSELGFMDCFKGTNRLRTGISTGVFLCQHLVGIVSPPHPINLDKLLTSTSPGLRPRILNLLLSARRPRRLQILRPRCWRDSLWCPWKHSQLVRRRVLRPPQGVLVRHGLPDPAPPRHRHHGRRAYGCCEVGAGRVHCHLRLRLLPDCRCNGVRHSR
ncbi:maltose permease [Colletotrichum chrysophilum]|uniref:Maltose permease n=1 Tax=Colletotrichum chrysophilum TaxID=1836956 RepID=A0AAD9AJD2_9PEZI|nr:maltose permease [Colletotrichum chrysophilum]